MTAGRLMLLDTAALYFRAFHALPQTITAPDGTPVNAVRGLLDMIGRLVGEFRPTGLVACWDDDWRPRWRVDLVPSYKAHRVAETAEGAPDVEVVPDPLTRQVPIIVEVLAALGVAVVGKAGYEADDVLGTLAATAPGPVDVVTGDRDLFQVIDDARDVRVLSTIRGMSKLEVVTDAVLRGRYGVGAAQYADFAALRGDPSDGLPGAPGIGAKTAAELIGEHGSLEGALAAAGTAHSRMRPRIASALIDNAEMLRAFKQIATLQRIDVKRPPDTPTDFAAGAQTAREFGMKRLAERLEKLSPGARG